ncbi:MAG: hypothetical protein A2V77_10110 [Anaeromyxobacter sp. RBG_16_69_14]|nr:MAG: hypothetical protein A2V77_10110 [Anaeromyxobacter sp. RBG_16_69_14]
MIGIDAVLEQKLRHPSLPRPESARMPTKHLERRNRTPAVHIRSGLDQKNRRIESLLVKVVLWRSERFRDQRRLGPVNVKAALDEFAEEVGTPVPYR